MCSQSNLWVSKVYDTWSYLYGMGEAEYICNAYKRWGRKCAKSRLCISQIMIYIAGALVVPTIDTI
jgi:hypothetical protein